MGKVHGSLARAGKVRGQTPKGTFVLYFCGSRGGLLYRNSHANFVGERSPLVCGENRRSEMRFKRGVAKMDEIVTAR